MHNRSHYAIIVTLLSLLLGACAYGRDPLPDNSGRDIGNKAASYALQMVGTHYRYGGANPKRGFDCSGLVHYSYNKAGYTPPRTTTKQRYASRSVSTNNLKKGDLLFFNQAGKRYGHVAIYVGNRKFVHAPSSGKLVRVDSLENDYWRRHLVTARRFNDI